MVECLIDTEQPLMHVEEIRARLRKQPFVPFRLHVSDGSRHDVLHHDFVLITAQNVAVAIGAPTADDIPQRFVEIDPLHITWMEPLPPNGRRRKRRPRAT